MTAVGDRFAETRLRRVPAESAPRTPARQLCPTTDRPGHLWWGAHCYLDKVLQADYGLTCDDYHALLALQGGRCALCRGLPRRWRLVIDHDHEPPYEVRGALHFTCNRLLGFLRALLWWLHRAARYLADPPGRQLGLRVPAAKVRRLEARAAARRRKAEGKRAAKGGEFSRKVDRALEQTTEQGG